MSDHTWARVRMLESIAEDILMHPSIYRQRASAVLSFQWHPTLFDILSLYFAVLPSPHHVTVCYKRRGASGSFSSRAFCATPRIYPHHALWDPISRYTHAIIPSDPLDVYWRWHCLWQCQSQHLMTEKIHLRSNLFSIDSSLHRVILANLLQFCLLYSFVLYFYS